MPYVAAPIVLDDKTGLELERRVRATTTPQRDVKRARIILLAAQGMASRQISKVVGMHESHVAMWRQRFLAEGLDGLRDAPRPGAPRRYGHDDWIKIAALATTVRDRDDPVATWTYQELADVLDDDDVGISRSQLWRILDEVDIKPHKVTGWLNRRDDPEFWDRVQDVCGLYLSPPANAVVYSVDEKTGIQAKERKVATTPAGPGRPGRAEFEYVRHGTASLLAAFEVTTGEVTATDIVRNNSVTFIDFLADIDAKVAPSLDIHVVMDNGSSHVSKMTTAWLADHPRFVVHYTPVHASWVNPGLLTQHENLRGFGTLPRPAPNDRRAGRRTAQGSRGRHEPGIHFRTVSKAVRCLTRRNGPPCQESWNQVELFFSIITRKVIKRGSFASRADLVSKLMRYIASYNQTAKPFAWTYSGKPLTVAA